jgi:hypothetical protein
VPEVGVHIQAHPPPAEFGEAYHTSFAPGLVRTALGASAASAAERGEVAEAAGSAGAHWWRHRSRGVMYSATAPPTSAMTRPGDIKTYATAATERKQMALDGARGRDHDGVASSNLRCSNDTPERQRFDRFWARRRVHDPSPLAALSPELADEGVLSGVRHLQESGELIVDEQRPG